MILDTIIAAKKKELAETKVAFPLKRLVNAAEQAPSVKDFKAALARPGQINIIAEFKQASPSKGIIRSDLTPTEVINAYNQNGAAAMSILTERHFFKGKPEFLQLARQLTAVPLLRKDFIIDEYQIYEARMLGADAILLIVAALTPQELKTYLALSQQLGLACLVEVHDQSELETALATGADIVGINNRNLHTFVTALATTAALAPLVPKDKVLVSESGITGAADIDYLKQYNINAVLIGELLMKSPSPGQKLSELAGAARDTH